MAKRERGAGRVYQPHDPAEPERRLQTWWIDYHVNGRRYRESSKTRKKGDALALLKLRMGEHATGQYVGTEVKRLTFEDLEAVIVTSYERKGHRSLGRLRAAYNLLAAAVLIVVLAWTHMNLVTFLLFGALVAWVGYSDSRHSEVEEAVRLAEKRLRALEVHVGLGEAWLKELRGARIAQKMVGGTVSEHVHWPRDVVLEAKWRELEEALEEHDDERIDRLKSEIQAYEPPAPQE